jgi:hypothetical protein
MDGWSARLDLPACNELPMPPVWVQEPSQAQHVHTHLLSNISHWSVLYAQAVMDPMYQYSLSYFAKLFNHCVDTAQASDDLPTRLRNLLVRCDPHATALATFGALRGGCIVQAQETSGR